MKYHNPARDVSMDVAMSQFRRSLTGTGFRRSTMKFSARCIMNRVNFEHRMRSISSACFILMLIRIELMDASIRTRSFSLREIVKGFRRTSFDPLRRRQTFSLDIDDGPQNRTAPRPLVCYGVLRSVVHGESPIWTRNDHLIIPETQNSLRSAQPSMST